MNRCKLKIEDEAGEIGIVVAKLHKEAYIPLQS